MKFRNLFLLLLLLQQSTIQTKSSVASYVKSFFGSEEPSQKVIHKEYSDIQSLEITQATGNVIIQTWKQKTVALEIVHEGSEEFLKKAHILVQKFNDKLIIINELKCKGIANTDLHVIIPEDAAISVNLEKGDITISQSNGALSLYTEQGDIQVGQGTNDLTAKTSKGNLSVSRQKMDKGKKIELTTEKGDLYLYTTETSNLDIDAQTLKGKISSTIPVTLHPVTLKINSKTVAEFEHKISGVIGKPLSKTKLFCYTGNVHIEPYI